MSSIRARLPLAATLGASTLVWYALPDAVRSRPARALLKGGLLAGLGAAWVAFRPSTADRQGPDAFDEVLAAFNEHPARGAAIAAAATAATVTLSVAGEKLIFACGERRRSRGVPGAHTWPALAWGALTAVTVLVDPGIDPELPDAC